MKIIIAIIVMLMFSSFVVAGVGVSWSKESSLVPELTKTCLTYKIYNPWPEDSYAQIKLSEELQGILSSMESETKYIPAETSSAEAIPLEFCFKTPKIYARDCWLFDKFICKLDCSEKRKEYLGEVEVIEVSKESFESGGQGSATQMSVSAPLNVRVDCIPHTRNYSLIYIFVMLIAAVLLAINLLKNKRNKSR